MPSGSENRPVSKTGAKSAKAIKAATRKKKGPATVGKGLPAPRQIPWMTLGAAAVIIALIGLLAWNLIPKYLERRDAEQFAPTADNVDPSMGIDGVERFEFPGQLHVTQRVAYKQTPPVGGPHDPTWAACNGVVYDSAIRVENAVHSLEHGAVWITYNPDQISGDALSELEGKADGKQFIFMSPYPGLDSPISIQAWGHQLKLDDPNDRRINQFIAALRQNPYTDGNYLFPEKGATCDSPTFDIDNPPPFDTTPLPPDAVQPDDPNLQPDVTEGAPVDPNQLPIDPNQLPIDPSQLGIDPNLLPTDPNAPPVDPNAVPTTAPGAPTP